jgi:hypothetical protein
VIRRASQSTKATRDGDRLDGWPRWRSGGLDSAQQPSPLIAERALACCAATGVCLGRRRPGCARRCGCVSSQSASWSTDAGYTRDDMREVDRSP